MSVSAFKNNKMKHLLTVSLTPMWFVVGVCVCGVCHSNAQRSSGKICRWALVPPCGNYCSIKRQHLFNVCKHLKNSANN